MGTVPPMKRRILVALLLILAACPVWAQLTAGSADDRAGLTVLKRQSSEPYCPVNLPPDPGELHPKRRHESHKVIHDRLEYNLYMHALGKSNPQQKAADMEEFVTHYPHSKLKIDALEQAMAAYQASGNVAKVADMANRLLQAEPGNLRALAVLVFLARDCSVRQLAAGKELSQLAQRGLAALPEWQEVQGDSLSDGAKLHDEMAAIFAGAAGWGALLNRDYAAARQFYEKAVASDPQNLQDLYQLALADLEMTPIDPNGFWYCGKSVSIARRQHNPAAGQMSPYCRYKLKKYGGKPEQWDQLVSNTEKDTAPPQDFAKSSFLQEGSPTPVGPVSQLPSEKEDPISILLIPVDKGSRVGAGIGSSAVSAVTVTPQVPAGVSRPITTYLRDPLYPKSALDTKDTKIQGLEKVEITIDVEGNVTDVSVLESLGPEFDQQAIAAAKQWKFLPATKDGRTVASKELIVINFRPGMPEHVAGSRFSGVSVVIAPIENPGPGSQSLSSSEFRSRYYWYVDYVRTMVALGWYVPANNKAAVRPVQISLQIQSDGSFSNVRIERSSGLPALDESAMRAFQRINYLGPPPTHGSVNVEVTFDSRSKE